MVIIKFMNKKILNNYIKQIEIHIDENEAINDLKSPSSSSEEVSKILLDHLT